MSIDNLYFVHQCQMKPGRFYTMLEDKAECVYALIDHVLYCINKSAFDAEYKAKPDTQMYKAPMVYMHNPSNIFTEYKPTLSFINTIKYLMLNVNNKVMNSTGEVYTIDKDGAFIQHYNKDAFVKGFAAYRAHHKVSAININEFKEERYTVYEG